MSRIRAAALAVLLLIAADIAHAAGEKENCKTVSFYTAAQLLATAYPDCTIGYALNTDIFYLRIEGAWASLGTSTALIGENSGTFSNGTNNVWTLGENSENLTLTYSTNLVTVASTTAATLAITPALAVTGDVTLSGGASALNLPDSASSIVLNDNDSTALLIGSTGLLDLVTLDTTDGTETVIVKGTTAQTALHVDIGLVLFDELLTIGGGAGAITTTNTAASWLTIDNDASALDIGSAGNTAAIRYVSTDNLEHVLMGSGFARGDGDITGAITLDASDCGRPQFVTAGIDTFSITLPALSAVPAGCVLPFHYIGADGGALLDISPNAADGIEGSCTLAASVVELSGTDDADIGLTKLTIKKGDTITLTSGDADDWYAYAIQGICANN